MIMLCLLPLLLRIVGADVVDTSVSKLQSLPVGLVKNAVAITSIVIGLMLLLFGRRIFKAFFVITCFGSFAAAAFYGLQKVTTLLPEQYASAIESLSSGDNTAAHDLVKLLLMGSICLLSGSIGALCASCMWSLALLVIGGVGGTAIAMVALGFVQNVDFGLDQWSHMNLSRPLIIASCAIIGGLMTLTFLKVPCIILSTSFVGSLGVVSAISFYTGFGFLNFLHSMTMKIDSNSETLMYISVVLGLTCFGIFIQTVLFSDCSSDTEQRDTHDVPIVYVPAAKRPH